MLLIQKTLFPCSKRNDTTVWGKILQLLRRGHKKQFTFNRFICEYDQFGPIIVVMIVTVDPGDSRGTAFFVEKLLISKVFCNFLKKLQRTPEWAWTL